MQTGTKILVGIEQGGREVAEALQIVQTTFIGLTIAFVAIGLFSLWCLMRNDAKRRKADREAIRVRTFMKIDGVDTAFDMKEAA